MTSFLELVPRDPASDSTPGAWSGLTLDQYANDRNVETITESELASSAPPGPNATPTTAQYLGDLGPFEKSGDEARSAAWLQAETTPWRVS